MAKILLFSFLALTYLNFSFAQDKKDDADKDKKATTIVKTSQTPMQGTTLFVSDDQKVSLQFNGYMTLLGQVPFDKPRTSELSMKYFRMFFSGQVNEKLGYVSRLDYRSSIFAGKEGPATSSLPGIYVGRAYGTYALDDSLKLRFGRIDNSFTSIEVLSTMSVTADLGVRLDKKSKDGISYAFSAIQLDPSAVIFETQGQNTTSKMKRDGKGYLLSAKASKNFTIAKDTELSAGLILNSSMGNLEKKDQEAIVDLVLSLPNDYAIYNQTLLQKGTGTNVENVFIFEKTFESRNTLGFSTVFRKDGSEGDLSLSLDTGLALVKGKDKKDTPLFLFTSLEWESLDKGFSNSSASLVSELYLFF